MLVGHFAVGLAAKRAWPSISLGTAVLAAMVADFLWCLFMLGGLEHIELRQGVRGAANYGNMYDVALSHSLLMTCVWGGAFAATYLLVTRDRRGAVLLGAVVASHWLLDVIAHRPDMPIAPGTSARYGLGLWASVPATLVIEGAMWVAALVVYVRATHASGRIALVAFWAAIPLLTVIWYHNIAGPPPPDVRTAPVGSLVLFTLVVAWAYWVDRRRPPRAASVVFVTTALATRTATAGTGTTKPR